MSGEDESELVAGLAEAAAAVEESKLIRPSTDAHAAAVTALLVADSLPGESGVELAKLARAILLLVERLGGDYLSDAADAPGDLVRRAETIRATVTSALEQTIPEGDPLGHRGWLEAIRLGSGVVDLVYDLRTLASVCASHVQDEQASRATLGAATTARSAADALEFALRAGESPEQARTRNTLARLWTLFVPAYEDAVAGDGQTSFPALAIVASHQRAKRTPVSIVPPVEDDAVPSSAEVEIVGVETVSIEPPPYDSGPPLQGKPSVPPSSMQRPRTTQSLPPTSESRRGPRHIVELEVGLKSESNFYVGFTENLSCTGVFIATYVPRPIGAKVEVVLTLEGTTELRVAGIVRWQRNASPDGWPGIGVAFEGLSSEDEDKIRKFLSLREPLFYED